MALKWQLKFKYIEFIQLHIHWNRDLFFNEFIRFLLALIEMNPSLKFRSKFNYEQNEFLIHSY